MKKWMCILCGLVYGIIHVNASSALHKIAIVNVSDIFQQSAQRMEVVKQLENEFKDRANELETMEHNLQMKMQTLQRDGATMKINERNELEKSLIAQREIFSNKAKIFQQENHARQTEERDKILNKIYDIVKNISKKDNYDVVFDTNAVIYYNAHIQDITDVVMKQVG